MSEDKIGQMLIGDTLWSENGRIRVRREDTSLFWVYQHNPSSHVIGEPHSCSTVSAVACYVMFLLQSE